MPQVERICLCVVLGAALPAFVQAKDEAQASSAKAHVTVTPGALRWGPPPQAIMQGRPPEEFLRQEGFQVAVVSGDPMKPGGVYTIRFKCGDGFRVAPHWHPGDEHLTVLQGSFGIGHGDIWDASKGEELGAGGYAMMPARMHHFGWCKGDTVVQAHGVGPFKIHWLSAPVKAARKGG